MEALPPTVYFSGYALETSTSKTIRIVNKGSRAIRVKTRLLQDPLEEDEMSLPFHLETHPTGAISPGLAMKVVVHFTPKNYSLASSILEVESDNSALVIPIYAFPMRTSFSAPKEITFGNVPIGETVKEVRVCIKISSFHYCDLI